MNTISFRSFRWVLSFALACSIAVVSAAAATASGAPRPVSVMTMNMFQGSELEAVLGATTPTEFVLGVTATYAELNASRPAERAARMADEIAAASPDLVGLQEAALWRIGSTPYPTGNAYDLVQLLLDNLSAHGTPYALVSIVNNLDATGPMVDGRWLRFTDRVAVIARASLVSDITNPQSANYKAAAVVPNPVTGPVRVLDGWAAVDAKVRGQQVRFVTTHLSPLSATIQGAEAAELVAGPGATSLPLIVTGDFNTDANGIGPDTTPTYGNMLASGFTDAWVAVHPRNPGLTCCHLGGAAYSERLDLVLLRGAVRPRAASLTGDTTAYLTASGLWPSDHAALIARLAVGDDQEVE